MNRIMKWIQKRRAGSNLAIGVLVALATQSLCNAQTVSLSEPQAEVVAAGVEIGVDPTPWLSLDIESFIRVRQELLYSHLFGTNVAIEEVYDTLLQPVDLGLDEFGTYSSLAITSDNQGYWVDAALVFPIEINADNGYETQFIDLAVSEGMQFYGIYGKLSTANTSVFFYGFVVHQEFLDQTLLIPIIELEDATIDQFDLIQSATSQSFTRAISAGCLDANGNEIWPDLDYIDCLDRARDKYRTDMGNRIRLLKRRGTLGVIIWGTAGVACISFPIACPVAIAAATAVVYDGVDAWSDYDAYAANMALDFRNCCRDLVQRQNP